MKVIKLSRVISCWCKVVEFLCGKLRNSAGEIFLPGFVKIAQHSSSNSTCGKRPRTLCRSASTANHDLNSGRAHHGHGVHEKLQIPARAGARGSRGRNGAQRAPEVGTGGPTMAGPRSGPLSSSGACAARSSDKSRRVSRLAPGCCCGGGFYRCWWWAEHTARLRANIHSVSALLPGACVPCCCT